MILCVFTLCAWGCRTVLLMNPNEVPADFLSVAEQLSSIQHSQRETYITLIKHSFQSTLGTKYPLQHIHRALQVCASEDLSITLITVRQHDTMKPTVPPLRPLKTISY